MDNATKIASAARWRNGLLLAAVLWPASCGALLERQARRLDALSQRGVPAVAVVTRVTGDGTTHYRYTVDGRDHDWNVRRDAAPFDVGQRLSIVYLPDDPSLSRPVADRATVVEEAAGNRRFSRRMMAGEALLCLLLAWNAHRELTRLREGRDPADPAAYRERIRGALVMLGGLVALVTAGHALDAHGRGESLAPVAFGALLSLAVLGGVVAYVSRKGPAEASTRSARIMRWALPLMIGAAVLRVLASLTSR